MTSGAATSEYRPDVDGLRAIAVVSVILFHLSGRLLPGGFVGVDVFFVISGFLITRNIIQDLEKSRFSLVEFYRRRIKRIAPPMLVIVLVTLVFAGILMLPEDSERAAKSAVWSLSSLANVYFWKDADTGYFAPDSRHFPLLHLWSLGVEEQFYLIFPLLLMLLYRRGRATLLFWSAAVIALCSFLSGELLLRHDPSFAYYMLPTRAGELLLGALVALVITNRFDRTLSQRTYALMSWAGFFVLLLSFVVTSEQSPFPGWRAMPPTLATALLILGGQRRNLWIARLLSLKPVVAIGLISYSAYLWHWPVLAFYRYGYGDVTLFSGAVVFALTMMLSWASYRWVEVPFRHSKAPMRQTLIRMYIAPAAVLGGAALILIYGPRFGFLTHSIAYTERLADIRGSMRPAFLYDYVCQRQRMTTKDITDERCVLGADSVQTPHAVLWGDSNAAHYVGVIGTLAQHGDFRFRNLEIGSCPPIDGDPTQFVETERARDCRESLLLVRPVVDSFPVVILSASWTDYQKKSNAFFNAVVDTVTGLTKRGKLVILIGKAPVMPGYDRLCREKALTYPALNCSFPSITVSRDLAAMNERLNDLARSTPNVKFFDVTPYLCPTGMCSPFGPNAEPWYYDESHLTLIASWKLGQRILERDGLATPFDLIHDWSRFHGTSLQELPPPRGS